MSDKIRPHHEVIKVEFNNFLDFVDNLSDEQKQELAQKLIGQDSPLTVVLGVHNVVNNSFALQINGDSEKIADQLAAFPPESIAKITEAIALWINKSKTPSNR